MSYWLALIVMAYAMATTGAAHAQELRCSQIFMNASEKRSGTSPEFMQLDHRSLPNRSDPELGAQAEGLAGQTYVV